MGLKWRTLGVCLLLLFSATLTTSAAHLRARMGHQKHHHLRIPGLKLFNVKRFGAVPDGKTDNTAAFLKAWDAACTWGSGAPRVVVPHGRFILGPVNFKGPCKTGIGFEVRGTVVALPDIRRYTSLNWIMFVGISHLLLTGHGAFDGQGHHVWPLNTCKTSGCKTLPPFSLVFGEIKDSTIQHITSLNSMSFHFHVFEATNLMIRRVHLIAPESSPNTDGIHVGVSHNVTITQSHISTGDDCISIGPGMTDLKISYIHCGPGHGISVGSLGKYPGETDVNGVSVINCTFSNTTNGLRIKTFQESTELSASNINFENIIMTNVSQPIVIDQEYCPNGKCRAKSASKVRVKNVKFQNIKGESRKPAAIKFLCSGIVPCEGIELRDINLRYVGTSKDNFVSSCTNAKVRAFGNVFPPACSS